MLFRKAYMKIETKIKSGKIDSSTSVIFCDELLPIKADRLIIKSA